MRVIFLREVGCSASSITENVQAEDFAIIIRLLMINPEDILSLSHSFLNFFLSLFAASTPFSLISPSSSLSLEYSFQPCKTSLILLCRLTNQIFFAQQTVISLFACCLSADGRLFSKSDGERKDGRVKE